DRRRDADAPTGRRLRRQPRRRARAPLDRRRHLLRGPLAGHARPRSGQGHGPRSRRRRRRGTRGAIAMAYCLAVRWKLKDGELDAVLAALRPLVEASRAESEHFKTYALNDIFPRRESSDRAIYETLEPSWLVAARASRSSRASSSPRSRCA